MYGVCAVNDQLLLAGLLCALGLNAITAWILLARASSALPWWTLSAIFQTLALPLVFVIVFLQPQAFSSLLAHAPYSNLVLTIAVPVLVLLMLWRLFVELTRTLPAVRRQRAEAALGRRVLHYVRSRQLTLPLLVRPRQRAGRSIDHPVDRAEEP
jgi:hypothetical protein